MCTFLHVCLYYYMVKCSLDGYRRKMAKFDRVTEDLSQSRNENTDLLKARVTIYLDMKTKNLTSVLRKLCTIPSKVAGGKRSKESTRKDKIR